MFDPLFAIAFLAAVISPIAVMLFLIVRKRTSPGRAAIFSLVVPIAGLIAYSASARFNYSLNPEFYFDEAPLLRLSISIVCGILFASLVGWLIWRNTFRKS